MDTIPRMGPASKKPRLDTSNDESIWGHDEFTADDYAQVDLISSQALSQAPRPPNNLLVSAGSTFQRHHSWSASPNENVVPNNAHLAKSMYVQASGTGSGCNGNKIHTAFKKLSLPNGPCHKPEAKSWNGHSTFGGQKLPGTSVQEVERQKQELKRLQEEKLKCEAELKDLDLEINTARKEADSLKQQNVRCQEEYEKKIANFNSNLVFKSQELASEQWTVSHQQHNRTNTDSNNKRLHNGLWPESQPRQKMFKSPLKVADDNGFPSSMTFSQPIVPKTSNGASQIAGKSEVVQCQNQNDLVLQLKQPHGIEIVPSLVDVLLQQAGWVHRSSGELPSNNCETNGTLNAVCDCITTSILVPKNRSDLRSFSPPCLPHHVQDEPLSRDAMTSDSRLLQDGGSIELNASVPNLPPELNFFHICQGLCVNCAKSLLPSINKALFSLFCANCATHVIPGPASSTSVHSLHSSVQKQCNKIDAGFTMSVQNAISTLRVLKQLVYRSPDVCLCLIFQNIHTRCKNVQRKSDPRPGTSFACDASDLDNDIPKTFHPIVQKLFKICSLQLQLQCSLDATLLQLTLEILGTVAISCPIDKLPRFLPLITPRMLQNCSSLALDGGIFVELVSLLGTLCSDPNIVLASCNQDESCFWIPISTTWQAARKELSHKGLSKLDNLMIKLLSICLTHEGIEIPFLSTDEIHCQIEVLSSLIIFLHSQLINYEESPDLVIVPTLKNGVSLLLQMATQNADFRRHRAQVNFEMFKFLHWLARVKTDLKIGPAADLLLEIWNIKE